METSNMKNIVVLKNLPSNLIEEAIVILKENKKVKKLELIDKKNNKNSNKEQVKDKQYILKEAEMLVSSYMANEQPKRLKDKLNRRDTKQYTRLKKYSMIVTILLVISIILNLF